MSDEAEEVVAELSLPSAVPLAPPVEAVKPVIAAQSPAPTANDDYEADTASGIRSIELAKSQLSPSKAKKTARTESAQIAGIMASASPPAVMNEPQVNYYQDQGRDKFKDTPTNPLKIAKDEPVSSFSIDIDTASYSFVRSSLNQNVLPQKTPCA